MVSTPSNADRLAGQQGATSSAKATASASREKGMLMPDRTERSAIVFESSDVTMGTFLVRPDDSDYGTAGQLLGRPHIVFPCSPVEIVRPSGRLATDRSVAVVYPDGEEYQRGVVSPEGDRCIWLSFNSDLYRETFGDLLDLHAGPPHVPTSRQAYALAVSLQEYCSSSQSLESLLVEELMLRLLDELAEAREKMTTGRIKATSDPGSALAYVQELIAVRYRDKLSLKTISQLLGWSEFHLCREFRKHRGRTIHQFRTELRMRDALESLASGADDLTRLALDLGFSSHSHFTSTFRRAFGMTPSEFREKGLPGFARLGAGSTDSR